MIDVYRGDIWQVALSPTFGSEQAGSRPCVILQNNTGNQFSPTVIVAPITSRAKNRIPTHVILKFSDADNIFALPKKSIVLLEQIRTIDKRRLIQFLGTINTKQVKYIDRAIKISLGLDNIGGITSWRKTTN